MIQQTAVVETSMGMFTIELFAEKAPMTVKNFLKLAKDGFYDGLLFHRVIKGFMIQGGCPEGTGRGGPGYTIKDEFHPDLHHEKGALSMANAGPNTGGSQFFITVAETSWLDGRHAVFGRIIKGMDIVEAISQVDTDRHDRPKKAITITTISFPGG